MCGDTRIPRDRCAGHTIPGETRIPATPVPLWLGLQFFQTIKVIASILRYHCSEERLSTAPWCFFLSFISSFRLQIAYRKVRNLRIGVNKLVG